MTEQDILNTPEIVDLMLDECITADARIKLHKRLEELCKLAIQAINANKEDKKMELREEEKGYLENDKESVIETAQNIIADESFQYGGNSLTVLEIINAIKDGYRLANLAEVDRRIGDAFDQGFKEGLRAMSKED